MENHIEQNSVEIRKLEIVYVVAPYAWEYNDEYYYKPDGEPTGTPVSAYLTEKEAQDEADRLTGKKIREEGVDDYCSGYGESALSNGLYTVYSVEVTEGQKYGTSILPCS